MHISKHRALALLAVIIGAMAVDRASAQDCGPFFFLCPRPPEPRVQPAPSAPPEPEYYRQQPVQPEYYRQQPVQPEYYRQQPVQPEYSTPQAVHPSLERQYAALYGPVAGEPFQVPAVPLSQVDATYLRRTVSYPSSDAPGTIIIDPQNRFLYLVMGGGRAVRYGVGVGRQGFGWSGVATIRDKQEWPDWYPPKEMLQRQPELMKQMHALRSGIGMAGGPRNPLGARAMYLWQGNKDTLYRIHGTNEPWTIGRSVSSGCIRMLNQDVIDLYERTPLGAKVVVLGSRAG
jgi:lipoprotein-anchoring transpeptidase ErfK/SrfK